jgi:PST family polysaccharide transporter
MTELVTRIAPPLVFVVLARLLTPKDFGVVGVAAVVIGFAQVFWDAGLGKALVQTKISQKEAANVVFWTNLGLALVIYSCIAVSAGWIAAFFHSPASEPVLRVLGLQIIILSLASVQQALLVKDLDFRQIFWAKLFLALTPAFFSIPLAFFGYGVWALVAGTLVGSFMNLTVLWIRSPWRPALDYNLAVARRLSAFCVWVVLEGLGIWFIVWGDQFLVGKFLTVNDLGTYRVATYIAQLVLALFLGPLVPVLYPTFSHLQDDPAKLKEVFDKANRVIIAIALPISAGLLLTGSSVAAVVFGEKWVGLGAVLGLLGLTLGLASVVSINAEVYRAIGRPDINTKFMYAQLLVYVPAYVIGVEYGLGVFVYVKLVLCLVAILCHVGLCVKVLRVSWLYLWVQGKWAFVATLGMSAAVVIMLKALAFLPLPARSPVRLALLALVGVVVYGFLLWWLDRNFVEQSRRYVYRMLGSGAFSSFRAGRRECAG